MEINNYDNNTHDFYFLVRNYVENKRKEEELFSILESDLNQEQHFIILDAISDILRFLKTDVESLKRFLVIHKLSLEKHHIQYFIDMLVSRLPHEDRTTFIFPDYKFLITIEKIKRSINILEPLPAQPTLPI